MRTTMQHSVTDRHRIIRYGNEGIVGNLVTNN